MNHQALEAAASTHVSASERSPTLTGLSGHTLRWYERVGLLAGVSRDQAGIADLHRDLDVINRRSRRIDAHWKPPCHLENSRTATSWP